MAILNKLFTNCLNSSDTQVFQYNDLLFVPGSIISNNGNCYRDTQISSELVATLSIKSSGYTNCQDCLTTTMTGIIVSGCSSGTLMYMTLPIEEVPPIGFTVFYNSSCWTVVSATTEFYNLQSNIPSFEDCEMCNLFGSTTEINFRPPEPPTSGDPVNWVNTQFVQCCNETITRWYEIDTAGIWGTAGRQVYFDFQNQISWRRTTFSCTTGINCISFGQLITYDQLDCGDLSLCFTPTPTITPTTTPQQYTYFGTNLFEAQAPSFTGACNQWNNSINYYGFEPFSSLGVGDYLYSASSRDFNSLVGGSSNNTSVLPLASDSNRTDTKYFQVRATGRIEAIVNCIPIIWYTYKIPAWQSGSFSLSSDACNFSDALININGRVIYGIKPIDQLSIGDRLYKTPSLSDPITALDNWQGNNWLPMYSYNANTSSIEGDKYAVRQAGAANGSIQTIGKCSVINPSVTQTPTPSSTGCAYPRTQIRCTSYNLIANGNQSVKFRYNQCTINEIIYESIITVGAYDNLYVCSVGYPEKIDGGPYGIGVGGSCVIICIDPTPTPTNTPTNTVTPTNTSTNTVTPTPKPSGTNFATPTPTSTPIPTLTNTPTITQTQTPKSSGTPVSTVSPSNTKTPTPEQTSSRTPTPNVTGTPRVTPSKTSRATTTTTRAPGIEECSVITVSTMGVTCNVSNSTQPGLSSLSLIITGGTPPYLSVWDHGPQGNTLTNLLDGVYRATVTDFFNDYSVRVFCTVSSIRPTPSSTGIPGVTPPITPSSTGIPGVTPPITPTPTVTPIQQLCATFTITNLSSIIYEQYQFSFSGRLNNANSWTANTTANYLTNRGSLLLYRATPGNSRWVIIQTGNQNNINWGFLLENSSSNNSLPLGGWAINGNRTFQDSFGRTNNLDNLQLISGLCSVPSLSMSVIIADATCAQLSDGSITIDVNGGTLPYTYSINGINFSPNNTFINLSTNTYTVYVRDSATPPQIINQQVSVGTSFSQPQPTILKFTRTFFYPGSNNNQPTIIDYFSQYELNLNNLDSGVSLSTLILELEIENTTKGPGITNANGTTITVNVNNTIVFTTGITSNTLWTQTITRPRSNVGCSTEIETIKTIRFTGINITGFLNRALIKTDTVVILILNKAEITTASTISFCPTELYNKILIGTQYSPTGPRQICFPVQGTPIILETASRSATQATSNTYTGQWRFRITNNATCITIENVRTSGLVGSAAISFSCNSQSTSSPYPFTLNNVLRGQTAVVQPPSFSTCNPISFINPENITVTYFMFSTNQCNNSNSPGNFNQCSGDYEMTLEVDNGTLRVVPIVFIPGQNFYTFTNVVINFNSTVTITIDCV